MNQERIVLWAGTAYRQVCTRLVSRMPHTTNLAELEDLDVANGYFCTLKVV